MNISGGNSVIIKEINTSLVSQILLASRESTKQQLARSTGLSLMTVAAVLQQLQNSGEVLPGELVPSAGGRPSRCYRYNPDYSQILGIYTIAAEHHAESCLCIANAFNDVIYTDKQAFTDIKPESFFRQIDAAMEKYPAVKAVGFGLPGVIRDGQIVTCDFSGFTGCNFEKLYTDRYGLPVMLDNDANCVVAGRCCGLELDPEAAVVAVYFPKICAIGAGIWINGTVYRGARHYAGELAGIPLGTDWCNNRDLYENPEQLSAAIAKLTDTLYCVLDPQQIVLYSSFLSKTHLTMIQKKCVSPVRNGTIPELVLSDQFEDDYRSGILYETRSLLKPEFELQKN